ncbi:hypothetical protein BGZ49_000532 [Haplosporangium sp. Z 27]|nr:hypothetical protein BGZ49_000532 [Haplosporangium sp. Z 27]
MRTQEFQDGDNSDEEPCYEVGQEQLDAVDRMLEELDLDEEFGRVPAAFRIVERFEQQQRQQQQQQEQNLPRVPVVSRGENGSNGHYIRSNDLDLDVDHAISDQIESEDDDPEPFGYIPLDQGYDNGSDDDDDVEEEDDSNNNEGYDQMLSDEEESDHRENNIKEDDDDDEGQGYDGYLLSANRDGVLPVPVIPGPVQIELDTDEVDGRTTEQIPEEDLETIAKVMSSFSLPAPDWAKAIPEERWLPRIVQQAATMEEETSTLSDKDGPLP